MKGVEFYYRKIEYQLDQWDAEIGGGFKAYIESHAPNLVYLWLEERKKEEGFPKRVTNIMKDLFWEIR
jgi:hypothetical protein